MNIIINRCFLQSALSLVLLCTSIWATASQQDGTFKYVKRYSEAGLLLGEFSPQPNSSETRRPAKRYFYTDPSGIDDRVGLLFKVEEGYISSWPDESVTPADWAFTATRRTQYTYDDFGRKRTEGSVDGGGDYLSLTQYSYDFRNRVRCIAVRMNLQMLSPALQPGDVISDVDSGGACVLGPAGDDGPDRITKYEYDQYDHVLTERRAVGTALEQVYVENEYVGLHKVRVTDANLNTARMQYDEFGRLYRWYFPNPEVKLAYNANDYEEYRYDLNGNRTYYRKRDESEFNFMFDSMNRMIRKDVPEKPVNHPFDEDVFYDYDTQGLQLSAMYGKYTSNSHSGIGVVNQYSGFGEMVSETSNVGGAYLTGHSFDKHGNKLSTTYHDNTIINRTYNNLDALVGINKNAQQIVWYGYTPGGLPEWKNAGSAAATTTLGYDDALRVKSIGYNFAGTTGDLTLSFGHNAASQVISKETSNRQYRHLDSTGNLGTYEVNGLNQYTTVQGITYDWDDNGNLTHDDAASYLYDKENRLVKVIHQNGAVADLIYDPNGRLVQYKVYGRTTNFVYDGDAIISEYSTASTHANYVHSNGMGRPLATFQYSGTTLTDTLYLHANHQGSIIAATDSSGTLEQINTYDAYGVPGDLNLGRFGYTGQVWLPEVGLYHYRARTYRPAIGRFLQTDPVGYEDQMNLYAYVLNDPMNRVDPTGMFNNTLMNKALQKAGQRYIVAGIATQVDSPAPGPGDVVGVGIAVVTTVALAVEVGVAVFSDENTPANADADRERADRVDKANGVDRSSTTTETITRPTKGGDGGTSEHILERDASGNAISKTHRVTTNGEVVHQHQEHIGLDGAQRSFPDEWVENPRINAD